MVAETLPQADRLRLLGWSAARVGGDLGAEAAGIPAAVADGRGLGAMEPAKVAQGRSRKRPGCGTIDRFAHRGYERLGL